LILFKVGSFIQDSIRKSIEQSLQAKRNKETLEYSKLLSKCTREKFVKELISYCQSVFDNDKEIEQFDENRHLISFKNGVYDLKAKEFRERTKEDYLTNCLSYDYNTETNKKIQKEIHDMIMHTANDDKDDFNSLLSYSGYTLTGETKEQMFLLIVGHTASNGKSTFMNVLCQAFEFYSFKPATETFNKAYAKAHKQFKHMKKPVRLVFIEEIDQEHVDTKRLKSYVDGISVAGNEVMYGTTEDIVLHSKLVFSSNFDPRFQVDGGTLRRGYMTVLTNQFLDGEDYEKEKGKKGVYLKDKDMLKRFQTNEYKLELMHFIIPYAEQYYEKGLKICKKWRDQFKEVCDNNDTVKQFIFESGEVEYTGNKDDMIQKDMLLELYNHKTGEKTNWNNLLSELKRLGIKYDRQKMMSRRKGVVIGIKEINAEQNEEPTHKGMEKTISKKKNKKQMKDDVFNDQPENPYEYGMNTEEQGVKFD
jgi:phage/plasmid-associated DNA primase